MVRCFPLSTLIEEDWIVRGECLEPRYHPKRPFVNAKKCYLLSDVTHGRKGCALVTERKWIET